MDSNEVNVKKKKRNRVIFIIASIFVVLVIILGVSHCVSVFMNKSSEEGSNSNTVIDDDEDDTTEESNTTGEDENTTKIDDNEILYSYSWLYDAYSYDVITYEIIKSDDIYYLICDDEVMSTVEVTDDYTPTIVNNDEIDENIYANCYIENGIVSCSITRKASESDNYIIYLYSPDGNTDSADKAVIYSLNTSTANIYEVDGYVYAYSIYGLKSIVTNYTEIHVDDNDNYYSVILNRITGKETKIEDYIIIGDTARLDSFDDLITSNSNYIVVQSRETSKYGLMDMNGNIVIEAIYDDLMISTYNNTIYAEKDGKVGMIDYNGNTVIDFIYDDIYDVDGYYVVGLNSKIGIIDSDGNIIVNYTYEYLNYNLVIFRPCCGDDYDFVATLNDDNTIKIEYNITEQQYPYEKYIIYDLTTNSIKESGDNE